jgi:hypothetical protein
MQILIDLLPDLIFAILHLPFRLGSERHSFARGRHHRFHAGGESV